MENPLTSVQFTVHCARRTQLGPDWRSVQLHDPFNRLYWVHSGKAKITYQRQAYVIRPGPLYLIPLGGELTLDGACDMDISYVHFNCSVLGGAELLILLALPFEAKPDSLTDSLLSRLQQIHQSGSTAEAWIQQGGMALLLAPFLMRVGAFDMRTLSQRMERFQGMLSHIETNLDAPLPVSELAAQMHLATAYFSKLFTTTFGQSPARYIRKHRIRRAMEYLLRTNEKLDCIAERCGFCDAYHLAKVFKQEAGIPPGAFRKRGVQP